MLEGLELEMGGKGESSLALLLKIKPQKEENPCQEDSKEKRGRVETFLGRYRLPTGDNHSRSLASAPQQVLFNQD